MKPSRAELKKITHLFFIWFFSALLGALIFMTDFFSAAERLALDRKFLLFQRSYDREDVTLITIDASSLDRFSRQFNLHWPWPRELYGMVVSYLKEAGVNTVTFDVLFDRPDIDRLDTEGPVSDRRFAEAIYNSKNVTLAANSVIADSLTQSLPEEFSSLKKFFLSAEGDHSKIPPVVPANAPISLLQYAAGRVGNAYVPTRHDGVIRSTYLMMPVAGLDQKERYYPSLPFAAYVMSKKKDKDFSFIDEEGDGALSDGQENEIKIRFSGNTLQAFSSDIPLQPDGTYRINWYSRGGVHDGTFPYYSFYDVFRSALAHMHNRPEMAPLDVSVFKGQNIVIGASAAGLADIKTTPFSAIEPYPGMEIQATVLANLLDAEFLGEMSAFWSVFLIFIFLIPVIYGVGMGRHIYSIIISVTLPLLILATGLFLFGFFRFIMPTVFFTGVALIGIGITYVYRYLTEERQKKMMRSAFSQYVQKEFVDRIADDPEQLKLGGQQKELTVMFTDMANFTSISEKLTPEELSRFLNDYLTDMTHIVFHHGGTLDKFIGDAVMAFWGAPIDQPDHALRACRCALDMQQRLKEHSEAWEQEGYPPVSIRIGINTGPMVVGNMGSKDRFNYTVLGDAVNLGARLEPLNKQYDTQVMISEFTLQSLNICLKKPALTLGKNDPFDEKQINNDSPDVIVRELDRITVKGKSKPVSVYELLWAS